MNRRKFLECIPKIAVMTAVTPIALAKMADGKDFEVFIIPIRSHLSEGYNDQVSAPKFARILQCSKQFEVDDLCSTGDLGYNFQDDETYHYLGNYVWRRVTNDATKMKDIHTKLPGA